MPRARDARHELTVGYDRGWFTVACSCGKWSDQYKEAHEVAAGLLSHLVKVGKLKPTEPPRSMQLPAVWTAPGTGTVLTEQGAGSAGWNEPDYGAVMDENAEDAG